MKKSRNESIPDKTMDTVIGVHKKLSSEAGKELDYNAPLRYLGLSEREIEIYNLKCFNNMSYRRIGQRQGVTGERIRQIFNQSLRKLRQPSRHADLKNFLQEKDIDD